MSPSYRMGRMGGKRGKGGCGIRSTFGLGARAGRDHIKRRASEARAQIEDGKHSRLANRVLHSMDLAIEERIENGIACAGAKIVPREKMSINGMKLILRPRMIFFKKILACFSAYVNLATAGRNDAKSYKE